MADLASKVTRSSKRTMVETSIATSLPKRVSNPNLFDCRKRYQSILLKVKDMPNLNTRLKNNYIYYPVQSIYGKDFKDVIIKFNVFIFFFK
jgi:hypothetical protein